MTEQEAIEQFKERLSIEDYRQQIPKYYEAMEIAVKLLEEIQKYRELGTLDELNSLIAQSEEEFNMLIEYLSIGTIDECRAAVEKQKAKKPIPIDYEKYMDTVINAQFLRGAYWCPNCRRVVKSGTHCNDCGQKLDWSDEE